MPILLIRHGETRLNAARVVQPADTPLSETGERQAQALARRLVNAGLKGVLTSDLPRAAMTAAPLVEATGLELHRDPDLQERNFGDLRGQAYDSLGFDPLSTPDAPPGGESEFEFRARVARAFATLVALRRELRGPLAVVTHGLVIRVMLDTHLRLDPGIGVPARIDNTSVTRIDAESPFRVLELNCSAHLAADERGAVHGITGI